MARNSTLRVRQILETVKPLAAEYYQLTGKPLGVTGEIAEYLTSKILKLELLPPRTKGHDALRHKGGHSERVQIKGRVLGERAAPSQRLSTIKKSAECDVVMVTLLDQNLDAREIWEGPIQAVLRELDRPGSKARERGSLGVRAFQRIAEPIWPKKLRLEILKKRAAIANTK